MLIVFGIELDNYLLIIDNINIIITVKNKILEICKRKN